MIRRILPLFVVIVACQSNNYREDLPYLGNTIYEESDTIYHTIQPFKLLDQDSASVTNASLADRVYVADFFFTSCPTICPKMKVQMLRVYEKFEGNSEVGFVSHTIDPMYDTIPLLRAYADRLGVNTDQWKFVWGDQDYMYDLAERSYMSIADEDANAPGGFVHSGAFLLVDKEGHVRGFYDGTVEEQVDVLISDIEKLLQQYQPKN